jgi:hypothetical protein
MAAITMVTKRNLKKNYWLHISGQQRIDPVSFEKIHRIIKKKVGTGGSPLKNVCFCKNRHLAYRIQSTKQKQ